MRFLMIRRAAWSVPARPTDPRPLANRQTLLRASPPVRKPGDHSAAGTASQAGDRNRPYHSSVSFKDGTWNRSRFPVSVSPINDCPERLLSRMVLRLK